ncbi:hemerythrin domain-containing protein [Cesiribacter andamanensis]|uniref:Iron-sulfur cluster repair di-iron protein n=1 Tax=Cesiribacter andamanensis AMV16 TaxID=1279009 RepID=M7N6G3_9BACT|nr:hemerythrin domain-containing protein [Cesiribacter andamanensis]EMR04208.1 iron-sulfur cluster repair di-iron protein [Cesiribacter andamanensis AMV16]
MSYDKSKITELIEKNYVFASVLYYFGIEFYEYSEQTLEQVCQQRGLRVQQVVDSLESALQQPETPNLTSLPVDIIIAYLKHSHYLFVKHKLPYIARLIQELSPADLLHSPAAEDLKFIFPLYVEDFIRHIYKEEDTLFTYILLLQAATQGNFHPGRLFFMMEKNTIEELAVEHDCHDDEMQGIRVLTNNYSTSDTTPLLLKVVYGELQAFEQSLRSHSHIEDEILFPKALALEKRVRRKWRGLTAQN